MCVTYRRILDWLIGFIDTLCSAIADLHALQFTVTHALVFSIFTSRIQATDLWQSHYHCSTHKRLLFTAGLSTLNWTLFVPPSSANCQLWNPQSNSLLQLPTVFAVLNTRLTTHVELRNWLNSNSRCLRSSLYSLGALPEHTASSVAAWWFTAAKICLPHRYLATLAARTTENTVLLLLRAFASAGMCLASRCLAMNYSAFQASCHNTFTYFKT
jgi:hypothetical protein